MKIVPVTLSRVFLSVALAGVIVACTDHAYDFDRIDRDITLLGEDISIPLGQSKPMTIETLLGEKAADYIVSLEDGTCAIQYKGKAVSFSFDDLKNIDGAAPFKRFCDFPNNYDFSLFNKPEKPSFDASGEADLSSLIPGRIQLQTKLTSLDVDVTNLPSQLASLDAITLTDKSRIEITVSVPDCLLTGGTITPDLSFEMGNLFESNDFPGGVIKIDTPLSKGNGYSATMSVPLHKFALDPKSFNPADHSLRLNAVMKFSGTCAVSQPRTNRDRYGAAPAEAKLHVTAVMKDIACKEIEGKLNYSRRSQVSFSLGDLSAGLKDKLNDNVRLDFLDPTILLDFESNVTIPVTTKLDLAARQDKVKYAEVRDIPVSFPIASSGSSVSKRFRISKNPAKNPGEEPIALDFTSLLSRIPDDILITTNVATLKDRKVVLRIGENYRVNVTPQLIIPLYLGPDTKVAVRDTVALPARLGEQIEKNSFQLEGEIDNGFPLQLAFSLVLVDENGAALTETVRQTVAADASTDIAITLTKLSGADLTRLASAILSFEVDGISDSRPIRMDDAIQVGLHLVIPGGFHLTL